ncbi:MAG: SpoIIE family protein phosphatase [Bacillaceae bacterium]|nr:SpoIIE family protein phosphatase [Bacillaceae bacterium]
MEISNSFNFQHFSQLTELNQIKDDKRVEKYLRLTWKVFENSLDGIMITDHKGSIVLVNTAFSTITGYEMSEVIGKNPRILKSDNHDLEYYHRVWKELIKHGIWIGEFQNKRKNGVLYIQKTMIFSLKNEENKVEHYVAIISDATAKRQLEEKLYTDLSLAKQIQKGLLSKPMKTNNIFIEGKNIISENLGGDLYVWYEIKPNVYTVILIDVMGHGVASALICMSIRSLLRGLFHKVTDPIIVMQELNQHMRALYSQMSGKTPYYFTAIYLVIDANKKQIEYVNAGHPPGLLLMDDQLIQLDSTCPCIGLFPDIEIAKQAVSYKGKTNILLYTDGLLNEYKSIKSEVEKLALEYKSIIRNEKIIEQLSKTINKKVLDDDVTFISIEIT